MTRFWRAGHWRTSMYGDRHWVEGHWVDRDGWAGSWAYSALPRASSETGAAAGTWVNPNATCPVCGAPVFFYSNDFGSRVFFDAMGHPWPKHPCTDSSSVASPREPSSNSGVMRLLGQGIGEIATNRADVSLAEDAYVVTASVRVGPRRHVTLESIAGGSAKVVIEPPSPPLWSVAVVRDFELQWYHPETGEHGRPRIRQIL